MDVTKMGLRGVMMLALSGVALIGLNGCASDSSAVQKEGTSYLVTGLGDDQDEALDNAKEKALDQCDEVDRDKFTILEQKMLSPGQQPPNDGQDALSGTTVTEDTDLDGLSADEDQYTAAWTIRCE
ncbi:hypothetical protein [Halomonas sp. PR-M31]|uniref:hypothetical protein n=1 Tax=Halomonas sp. PR-M31 TaxID=1471202 RepID=UPI000650160E|nr:hypothetical protein [Halomonas sp. PR-M31]